MEEVYLKLWKSLFDENKYEQNIKLDEYLFEGYHDDFLKFLEYLDFYVDENTTIEEFINHIYDCEGIHYKDILEEIIMTTLFNELEFFKNPLENPYIDECVDMILNHIHNPFLKNSIYSTLSAYIKYGNYCFFTDIIDCGDEYLGDFYISVYESESFLNNCKEKALCYYKKYLIK